MKKWRCGVCGYIHDGGDPPERCPKCGAAKEMFSEIPADGAALLERARLSNGLHAELHALLGKVREVAQRGIDDNLDPGCVAVFRYALAAAEVAQGTIKAEIATHVGKGKWG
ncbi:MAG: rubredoxin-like domain-containing protein [Bacteroidota bacterium]